jgi:integrase
MKWRHVDLDAARVRLDWHKTAKSTGKPKVIKLPAAAQELIARQPKGGADDLVFAIHRPDRLTKVFDKIHAEAGLPAGLSLHSLRHSLASHLAMSGASNVELMKALGHTEIKTSQRYITFAEDRKSALAERGAAPAFGRYARSRRCAQGRGP